MDKKYIYKCPRCSSTFKDKTGLNKHSLTHAGIKQYSCLECSKHFTQKGSLDHHMRSIHLKIKTHKCSVCTSVFPSEESLGKPLKIHRKCKNYTCPLCPAAFIHKGALKNHLDSAKHKGKID